MHAGLMVGGSKQKVHRLQNYVMQMQLSSFQKKLIKNYYVLPVNYLWK